MSTLVLDGSIDGPMPAPRPRSVTAARTECQFHVALPALPDLVADLRQHLVQRPSAPEGQLVTTLYFDTPWRSVLKTSEEGVLSDRLRLREYPAATPGGETQYWLERKRRLGQHSEKQRRQLSSAEVVRVLGDPLRANEAFRSLAPDLDVAPLSPTLVGQYRRLSFSDEGCRVTLDRDVSFFSPPRGSTLPFSMVGSRPVLVEPHATLEVKVAGASPGWLEELVTGLPRQADSKFVRGSHALAAAPRP